MRGQNRRKRQSKNPEQVSRSTPHSRARKLLLKVYRSSSELDALLVDHFPDVSQQVSPGWTTDDKISLLFRRHPLEEVLASVREDAPDEVDLFIGKCSKQDLETLRDVPNPSTESENPPSRRRDIGLLALGALFWEKVRGFFQEVYVGIRLRLTPTGVGILAAVAAFLVALAGYLTQRPMTPTALNDLGSSEDMRPLLTPSSNSPYPSSEFLALLELDPLLEDSLPAVIDLGAPEWPDMSHGSRRTKPTDAFNPSATSVQDQAEATEPTRPPRTATLPDFATEAPTDLLRTPWVVACPESLTIEVQPGSEMIIDEERGRHSIIAAMIETAKSDHIVELRPKCEAQASSASSSPIHFVSKMKINSTVTNNQKMCPPGSSKNCYDLVSRRVTCEFSFAINGFTSGYSCPTGKYFQPVKFEINYHEPSNAQPPWNAARRGDYAIERCRTLAGAVVQVAVCKRR